MKINGKDKMGRFSVEIEVTNNEDFVQSESWLSRSGQSSPAGRSRGWWTARRHAARCCRRHS